MGAMGFRRSPVSGHGAIPRSSPEMAPGNRLSPRGTGGRRVALRSGAKKEWPAGVGRVAPAPFSLRDR
jgi:hypothetical protein